MSMFCKNNLECQTEEQFVKNSVLYGSYKWGGVFPKSKTKEEKLNEWYKNGMPMPKQKLIVAEDYKERLKRFPMYCKKFNQMPYIVGENLKKGDKAEITQGGYVMPVLSEERKKEEIKKCLIYCMHRIRVHHKNRGLSSETIKRILEDYR